MTTFLLIIMALLLVAALERTNRRQTWPPGLNGSRDRDDRDWARIKLDLLALDGQAGPLTHKPDALNRHEQTPALGLRHTSKPVQQRWSTNHRNGPHAA